MKDYMVHGHRLFVEALEKRPSTREFGKTLYIYVAYILIQFYLQLAMTTLTFKFTKYYTFRVNATLTSLRQFK